MIRGDFKVLGRVELDGTHRAVVEMKTPESWLSQNKEGNPRFLRLQAVNRACGCILAEMRYGDENRILLDRFKQRYLEVRDGGFINVEESEFGQAKEVKIQAPINFSHRDIDTLRGKPITKGEKTALYTFSGEPRPIAVEAVDPDEIVVVMPTTNVTMSEVTTDLTTEAVPITYADIGGLEREIKKIREAIEYPLRFPEIFEFLGVSQPRGAILYGPPGTGKTLIARALANEIGAKIYSLSGPEIYSKWYGESERELRDLFDEAKKNAPSLIVIDELDALAPRRDKTSGEMEHRIVASLLTLVDGLTQLKGVVVVGTSNRIDAIDMALRRAGRLDLDIHVGAPDEAGRKDILRIHTRKMPLAPDVNLDLIAQKTVGFVGADITALCLETAYNTLRRSFPAEALAKGVLSNCEDLLVAHADFEKALKEINPSAMKEFFIEIPKEASWNDVGGLGDVKRLLTENIGYAITKRRALEKMGVRPARGILLYGPPGTGKTLLAKTVARECGANFIAVRGPEIHAKWFGESEERIRLLFSKAREVAPCVIFFDEIDALVPIRGQSTVNVTDSIVNQLLTEMDGIENTEGVFVIGATNRSDLLDPAILRPGRFDYQIEVPLPDEDARKAILEIHLKGKPLSKDVDFSQLLKLTEGFSGAEIAEGCRESGWEALRGVCFEADEVKVTQGHIVTSFARIQKNRDKLKPKSIGFLA